MTASKKRSGYEGKKGASQRERLDARKAIIMKRLNDGPGKASSFHQKRGYHDHSITIDSLIELKNEARIQYNDIHQAWTKTTTQK